MESKTFVGFNTGTYKYRRMRDRKDGIVRLQGFANPKPEAWAFMLRHRPGDGPLNAMYADGTTEALVDARARKWKFSALRLCWRLMPDDVRLVVEAFGGRRP